MFPWSNKNVMNTFVHIVLITEDDINISKENVSPPLPVLHPEIYSIVVTKIIRYSNTSHFIIVFLDAVHA